MTDTKILFSKSAHLDQMDSSTVMESQAPEKPPTYEESANSNFVTCPPTTSIDANGSIQISMDRLPSTSASPSGSASGSSVSVDQMVEELSALQRAQIHLYKRLQHVKSQTYAALALVLLMAGLIVIFLATYHHEKPSAVVAPAEAVASHRTGKALVGGGTVFAHSSNSIDDDHHDDTEMLLKHLSRIVTSTAAAAAKTDTTEASATGKVSPTTTENVLNLQVFKVNSVSTQEISRSDLEEAHGNSLSLESSHELPTVKVFHANVTFIPAEATSTTTSTTTTTTSTTTEAETESEPEPETEKLVPLQDTYNISIVVHSATVPNMDYLPLGRASDTYCDVFIDDVLIGSTPIIDNNNNPNWQYLLPRSYKVRKESTIRVDLLDRDHLKKDHIGGVVMQVGDLVNTNRMDRPVKFFHGRGDVWVTVKLV